MISRPYAYNDTVHMAINYEFDRDLVTYEREAFTAFEWFGNVGGLSEALTLILGMLTFMMNYNFYSTYMVSKLYQASASA